MRVAWLCIFMYSLVLCSVTENKERPTRHQSGRLKLWHKTQSRLSTHRKKQIAKKNQLGKSYNYITRISISIYNSCLKYRLFSRGYRRFFMKRSKDESTFQNFFLTTTSHYVLFVDSNWLAWAWNYYINALIFNWAITELIWNIILVYLITVGYPIN